VFREGRSPTAVLAVVIDRLRYLRTRRYVHRAINTATARGGRGWSREDLYERVRAR
jgi:hypothetical protein